jgi:hypothetical protein
MNSAFSPIAEQRPSKPRWFHLTPGRWLFVLLLMEGLLWLSDRSGWPEWHKGYAVLIAIACVGLAMWLMLFWLAVALLFRRRVQFSLRSLLLFTIVVAIPCSWFAVEMKRAREQRTVVEAVKNLGGWVKYDDGSAPFSTLPEFTWLWKLLGDDFLMDVGGVILDHRQVTEADLEHLTGLTQLKFVSLYNTPVTDPGLECLKGLTQLEFLSLCDTRVTDAGLAHCSGLTQLRYLRLNDTKVTDKGVKKLQQALPNCEIEHW